MQLWVDFPQFLDTNAVGLRVFALVQVESGDKLLAQMTACAFGKQGVFGMQFHPELERVGRLSMTINSHVAGSNPFHRSIVVIEYFRSGKAWENFNTEGFSLLTQPTNDIGQRDDIIAVILEAGRQHQVGCFGQ